MAGDVLVAHRPSTARVVDNRDSGLVTAETGAGHQAEHPPCSTGESAGAVARGTVKEVVYAEEGI